MRAEYGYPCVPWEDMGANRTGFSSGIQTVEEIKPDPPIFEIRVNDTSPIFFYCSANSQYAAVLSDDLADSLVR